MCFVSRPSAVCYSSLLCFYAPIGSSRSSLFSCLFFCDVSGSTLLHPSVSVKQQNFKIWTFSWQSCPPDVARALEVVVAWVARRCTSLALWKFDCILTGFFCCCCVIRTGCHFPWTLGLVVNWTSAILHFCRSPATSLDHPPTLPAPFGQSAIPRLKKTTETIRKQKKWIERGKNVPEPPRTRGYWSSMTAFHYLLFLYFSSFYSSPFLSSHCDPVPAKIANNWRESGSCSSMHSWP